MKRTHHIPSGLRTGSLAVALALSLPSVFAADLDLDPGITTIASGTINYDALGTVSPGAVLRVDNSANVTFTTAPTLDAGGILGGWAHSPMSGSPGTGTGNFLTLDGNAIVELSSHQTSLDPADWATTDNVKVTAPFTLAGSTTIHSLNLDYNARGVPNGLGPITIGAGNILTLNSGAVIIRANEGNEALGTSGTLASPGNLYLHVHNGGNRVTNIRPVLSANGGGGDLVVAGHQVNIATNGPDGWPFVLLHNSGNTFQDVHVSGTILRITNTNVLSDSATKSLHLNGGAFANDAASNSTLSRNIVVGENGGLFDSDWNNRTQNYSGTVTLNGDLNIRHRQGGRTDNFHGVISGTGGLILSGGEQRQRVVLNNDNTFTGNVDVSRGTLVVNGSIASGGSFSLGANGRLEGTGTVDRTIGGSGLVSPGNSPGILTVDSIDPTGGLDFLFEFTQADPTYGNASASGNDVLRLTNATAFTADFTAGNQITLDFTALGVLQNADSFRGGFFTLSDTTPAFENATFQYLGTLADPELELVFNGMKAQSANFGAGSVDGYVMEFAVIPEPGTLVLLGIALGCLAIFRRRS
ncbi:MAG: PEP-CTERM sorting domain-containing protein [Verrucomicrobia bacterium]|nr:PEP-CTERM sorting domain-containing protein [Verrucomicrobiota bacterium]MCH8513979.1 PEP-CTERM sorting domain-containing protein [Kiritimatiellia bacterium]